MFKKLLSFEEAKKVIDANFEPASLGEEESVLLEVYNRVSSRDIISSFEIPPYNTSTVTGYAIKAEDTIGANENEPVTLKIIGCLGFGETFNHPVGKGEAVEVALGAVIPEGSDAVISLQDIEREDDTLNVFRVAESNQNIQKKGSDIQKDTVIFESGQLLGASEIGVLASLRMNQVKVKRLPMVAILSVSNEELLLASSHSPVRPCEVASHNVFAAVIESGAKPVYLGVIPKDSFQMLHMLRTAINSTDIVVVCGNSDNSEIVNALGKPGIVVNGIAIKPGKTTAVGFVDGKPVFFLPEDPTVALLLYVLFIKSLVQRLGGRPVSVIKTVKALSGSRMFSAKGHRKFIMVKLSFDKNCRLIADPVDTTGYLSALIEACGFIEITENKNYIDIDQEVEVYLFRGYASNASSF